MPTARNGSTESNGNPSWMRHGCDKISVALCKVQAEMGVAKKKSDNPFFKSKYADLAEIMSMARVCAKHGIAITQVTPKGVDYCITGLMHSSGQFIESYEPVKAKDNSPQAWGSAKTYARRFGLAAALGIVSELEDDDGEAAQARESSKARTFAKPKFKKQEAGI